MNSHCCEYLGFNHIFILTFFLLSYLHIVLSAILWCKALRHYLQLNPCPMQISLHTQHSLYFYNLFMRFYKLFITVSQSTVDSPCLEILISIVSPPNNISNTYNVFFTYLNYTPRNNHPPQRLI